MEQTALAIDLPPDRMSFTVTIRLCQAYAGHLLNSTNKQRTRELLAKFSENIKQAKLPARKKERSYPREIKLPRDRYPTAGIV